MGFEPTRAEHNGLAVHRLNHSATSSIHTCACTWSLWISICLGYNISIFLCLICVYWYFFWLLLTESVYGVETDTYRHATTQVVCRARFTVFTVTLTGTVNKHAPPCAVCALHERVSFSIHACKHANQFPFKLTRTTSGFDANQCRVCCCISG